MTVFKRLIAKAVNASAGSVLIALTCGGWRRHGAGCLADMVDRALSLAPRARQL